MAANQSDSSLKRSVSSNFWELKSANHVKFPEKCVMSMEKNVSVKKKKLFTNGLNMCCHCDEAQIKKTLYEVEMH